MEALSYSTRAALEMPKFHGRNRGLHRPVVTGIPALLRGLLLSLSLTLPLAAGVTYDQAVRTGSFDGTLPLQSRVPSIDPPVFDIPSTLYAPPLDGARPITFRILLAGDRLVRIGKDVSAIFDLKARTVTVVQPKTHSYSVETLDEAQQRVGALLKDRPSPWSAATSTAEIQKTGQTRQIQGQTAGEYRIIAITLYHGKRLVSGSSVYWMAPKPPSDELAAFQSRWSRECSLPFPGMPATATAGDASGFGVMAGAAAKLAGYPILYVVESRPLRGTEIPATPPMHAAARGSQPEPGGSREVSEQFELFRIVRVNETAFSGFVAGAVDPSVFTVPAGYKERRSLRYMPD